MNDAPIAWNLNWSIVNLDHGPAPGRGRDAKRIGDESQLMIGHDSDLSRLPIRAGLQYFQIPIYRSLIALKQLLSAINHLTGLKPLLATASKIDRFALRNSIPLDSQLAIPPRSRTSKIVVA